ncbi:MAG: type III-A CRISPR-associated protein Cas10/Csm1 [Spirochaetia bacterium]|jgi:CRISPR-associated protein Csm1|nr:type III-A CRISPR-associated protein Cas10/Csm1 [Spirochaetia bacterium]
MQNQKTQYEIAIAALLHDIGKFKQRAYKGVEKGNVSSNAVSMEGQILPPARNEYGYAYRHALWTYDFFQADLLPIVRKIQFDMKLDWEKIARESASHHNPSTSSYAAYIAEADRVSAANDRVGKEEEYRKGSYYKKPLRSLFPDIHLDGEHQAEKSLYYYALAPICKTPYPSYPFSEGTELDYKRLWDEFLYALHNLPESMTILQLLAKLKDLLLEYTWCIPSATNDNFNDVSLYDHSVTTMAFALALSNGVSDTGKVRVFAADVSGIQQFIFQSKYSSFKYAAKIFRGRSFIVSAFSKAFKLALANELGLIPFTDIIDAGGKFTILLPNDDTLVVKLDDFMKKQEDFFLKKYMGSLAVLADYSKVIALDEFGKDRFRDTQKELARLLNAQKGRKYSAILADIDPVLRSEPIDGNRCQICGKHTVHAVGNEVICSDCKELIRLGGHLLKFPYIALSEANEDSHGYEIVSGLCIDVCEHLATDDMSVFSLQGNDASYPIWRLNTYSPDTTFEEIGKSNVDENGIGKHFLAYVKIDVDNLGEIFIHGFPSDTYSISRYVTLSRLLNTFFNVHVYYLLEENYPMAYTVLSGGDDVFIILPWKQAASFVLELRKRFADFCCQNEALHFSAGIVVGGSSEPFSLLDKRANEALDGKAKEFEEPEAISGSVPVKMNKTLDGKAKKSIKKNCVCYFNVCFTYPLLEQLLVDSDTLQKFIRDEAYGLSSGFVYRMYRYVNDSLSKDLRKEYSVFSKIRYDLVRNVAAKDELKRDEVFSFFLTKFDNFKDRKEKERFKVMLMHTMYMLRKDTGKENE